MENPRLILPSWLRYCLRKAAVSVNPVAKQDFSRKPDSRQNCRARILVVDDEPAICRLFSKALREFADVETAPCGKEAFKQIEKEDFDLVISDLDMPRTNGLKLYNDLISVDPEYRSRFFLLTGDISTSLKKLCAQKGIPLFVKPLPIRKLKQIVYERLASEEGRQDNQ